MILVRALAKQQIMKYALAEDQLIDSLAALKVTGHN